MPPAHADTINSLLKTPFHCPLVAYLPAEAQNVHQQIIHGTSSQFPALTALLGAITRQDRDIFDGAGHSEDDFHALWDDIIRNTLHLLSCNCESLELEMTRNRIDIYDIGVLKNPLIRTGNFSCCQNQVSIRPPVLNLATPLH